MNFKKVLGFWDMISLGIGGMVGVAILAFPSRDVPDGGPSSIISWVLAGVFSFFGLSYTARWSRVSPSSGALVARLPLRGIRKDKAIKISGVP